MASICLVTSGHLSTNPRIVKEADCLAEAGHQVTVLATRYLAWAEETDALFAGRGWVVAPPVGFGPRAPILTRLTQIARQRLARLAVDGARMKHHSVVNADWHQATPTLVRAAKRIQADLYIAHYPAALPAAALAAPVPRATPDRGCSGQVRPSRQQHRRAAVVSLYRQRLQVRRKYQTQGQVCYRPSLQ